MDWGWSLGIEEVEADFLSLGSLGTEDGVTVRVGEEEDWEKDRGLETKESLMDDLESDPKDLREELDTKESLEDALELADEVVEGGEAVSRWAGM